jgi:hypothetical protein
MFTTYRGAELARRDDGREKHRTGGPDERDATTPRRDNLLNIGMERTMQLHSLHTIASTASDVPSPAASTTAPLPAVPAQPEPSSSGSRRKARPPRLVRHCEPDREKQVEAILLLLRPGTKPN